MLSSFKKIVGDKDLYLDCECPARWVIASDKLKNLYIECEKNIGRNI